MRTTNMNLPVLKRATALFALLMLLCLRVSSAFAADFLDPQQAFKLTAELNNSRTVLLHWEIAKGYKLYRDKVTVSVESGKAEVKAPVLPKGIIITDPSTNEKIAIYHDKLDVGVSLVKADAPFTLSVVYQGCAEDGLCYPPITRLFKVDPAKPGLLTAAGEEAATPSGNSAVEAEKPASAVPSVAEGAAPSKVAAADNDLSLATATLAGGSLWKIALAFLAFGLLLSFTPCVLPMVPILSSIIVGEGDVTRRRSFLMALAYCLGMALVYTSLGVAAGLAGEGLAGALLKKSMNACAPS